MMRSCIFALRIARAFPTRLRHYARESQEPFVENAVTQRDTVKIKQSRRAMSYVGIPSRARRSTNHRGSIRRCDVPSRRARLLISHDTRY